MLQASNLSHLSLNRLFSKSFIRTSKKKKKTIIFFFAIKIVIFFLLKIQTKNIHIRETTKSLTNTIKSYIGEVSIAAKFRLINTQKYLFMFEIQKIESEVINKSVLGNCLT